MNFQMPPEDEKWMDAYIKARNLSWWALWRAGFRPSVNWRQRRVEWVPGAALVRSWEGIENAAGSLQGPRNRPAPPSPTLTAEDLDRDFY